MPNFTTTGKDVLESVNYLLAGPQTLGQVSRGVWDYGGGYFLWSNVYPPYIGTLGQAVALGPIPNGTFFKTPAYVFVNTTSKTDSVFVTAQLRPFVNYTWTNANSKFSFQIIIYRYLVDESRPGWYIYDEKLINYEELASDNNILGTTEPPAIQVGNASFGETIFCSIVNNPGVGRWMYSMELYYKELSGDPVLHWAYGENIGLTATVIKI